MRQEKHFVENATTLCDAKQCDHMCLPAARIGENLPIVSCVCSNGVEFASDRKTCTESVVPASSTPQKPPTTTPKGETTKPTKEATTKRPAVTTGHSGYTVIPTENKTESVPMVQPVGSSGLIAVITSVIVAVILITLFTVGCLIYRRWNSKNRKSMNFDNPV